MAHVADHDERVGMLVAQGAAVALESLAMIGLGFFELAMRL